MNYKNIISDLMLLQSLLSKSGLLSAQPKMTGFSIKLGYFSIFIVILLMVGLTLGLTGLYLYLITIYAHYVVFMIMGSILCSAAIVAMFVKFLVFYRLQSHFKKSARTICDEFKDGYDGIYESLGELADKIDKPVVDHPKLSMAAAFLAGFILTKKLNNL
jgi:hypothetical protein